MDHPCLGVLETLELLAAGGCETTHKAPGGACFKDGRTVDAQYGADRACTACIAWAALEKHRELTERRNTIVLKMEPFFSSSSIDFFRRMTASLVDEIVAGGDVEMAIEGTVVLDEQRRRLDRMQAVPPARRQ